MMKQLISLIPPEVRQLSGSAFNTGTDGYLQPCPVYLLGVNPGGGPAENQQEIVLPHAMEILRSRPRWSGYADASWLGRPPGTSGMQPRVLHLLKVLELDPRLVPASNLVFARSAREAGFDGDLIGLALKTWPFHQHVINGLKVKMVICMGQTAGNFVRERVGADALVASFTEKNNRRWTSTVHKSASGMHVATLTHPSIANWCNPATDPSGMVRDVLMA